MAKRRRSVLPSWVEHHRVVVQTAAELAILRRVRRIWATRGHAGLDRYLTRAISLRRRR